MNSTVTAMYFVGAIVISISVLAMTLKADAAVPRDGLPRETAAT